MKQVIQNLRTGVLELMDIPCPEVRSGHMLVQTVSSLISAGTERSLVEFGRANLVSKARQNPDRVKQVIDKVRSDGLLPTIDAVRTKLDSPLPLGYCNAGIVMVTANDVTRFGVGDRVASNGPHAEIVLVPQNLTAKIPTGVPDDEASFAVLGSIALQGIRLLQPELGEIVVVYGLGLVGLMAVQMLIASGTEVLGIDLHEDRLELARQFGAHTFSADDPAGVEQIALSISNGQGVDGVLITASAKKDNIVNQSARVCRKRGRIVLVGVTELKLDRAEFYEKELSFQVSCSYGPGRYDSQYEQKGIDYPYGFVRWTEQRNIQAILDMMAAKRLNVAPLITTRISQSNAVSAYDRLSNDSSQLGIVLQYDSDQKPTTERIVPLPAQHENRAESQVVVGVIGAGGFTKLVLLPALRKSKVQLETIASAGGVSSSHAGRKFGFASSTTDYRTVLDNPKINTVFITTPHDQHVRMVIEALEAGKHVLVEKPLATNRDGLQQVREAFEKTTDQQLMVGFNRRFSPHAKKMKLLLDTCSQPKCMTMLFNAGVIPPDHWQHDLQVGGGRMIGEGCHCIDLFTYLAGSLVSGVQATMIGDVPGVVTRIDHMSVTLAYANGSVATLHYFANGHRSYPKEQLTVFCEGKTLELDNFRVLTGYGWSEFRRHKLFRQDKGREAEIHTFLKRVAEGGDLLIPPEEMWNTTEATIRAHESACRQQADKP